MPILCVCPGCGKSLGVPEHALGKQVRCQACQLVFAAEKPADEPLTVVAEPVDTPAAPIAETPLKPAKSAEESTEPLPVLDEPAPTRRRTPARKQSSGAAAVIVVLLLMLAGGLVALVCAGGIGWWLLNAARPDVVAQGIPKDNIKDVAKLVEPPIDQEPPQQWGNKKPWAPDEKAAFKDLLPFIENQFPPFVPGDPRADGPKEKEIPAVLKTGTLPPLPAPLPIKPAPLAAETVTKAFPGAIQNVVLGGGGRFLILHLPKIRQLAVFDVNEAKVVKYLPVAADNAMIAAGMTKLVVAFPDTKIIQRWNLLTFQRELTATLPINDGIAGIGMGYGSDGPLLIQTVREPISGDNLFLDIRTMKLINLQARVMGHVHRGANAQIRGSLDGRSFGAASGGGHPYLLTIEAGGAVIRGADGGMRVVPGPDGKTAFGFGLYNAEMKRLGGAPDNSVCCVPALMGPFYLAIPAGTFHPQIPGQRKSGGVELRIVGDNRPILTLPEVDNAMRDVFAHNRDALTIDQRYHFVPEAQLLVTIPHIADRLLLHKLNLDDALEKAGIDYLFVASTPPPYAVRGEDYSYPVRVRSKKGGLKFRVDAGPDGMKVSANGTVTWKVPADHAEGPTDIIMTISDSAGQEIFHTFKLNVVRERPPDAKPPAAALDNKEPVVPPKQAPEPELVVKVPAPPAPDALTIRAPKLDQTPLTRMLPATLDQLAIGGGGRFLLMRLPSQRKIALFDANDAKIVHYFPVAGDNVRFAASLDKLVMVFPDTRVIQRWNLLTRQREVTATLEGNGTIATVLMGSASHGPLVVATTGQFGAGGNLLIDLATLRAKSAPQQGNIGGRGLNEYACISADGTVIACWGSGSPSGLQIYHVTPTGLKSYYEHISPGHLMPSPDGKVIYTSRGMFTNEAKPLGVNTKARDGMGRWSIPAACGDYYLSVDIHNNFGGKQTPQVLSVHLQGEERALVTLPEISLPKGINAWGREKFGDYRRIVLIPDAKMIVTVADTNDRLVIHHFDIDAALDKAGIDYLYATSRPPSRAVRGKDYVYRITTRSKKGGVTYKLESGPDGMRISKTGIIVWHVPADQPAGETNVIVTIADASGQEIFHTFRVLVGDAPDEKR